MSDGKRGGTTMVSLPLAEYKAMKEEIEQLKEHVNNLDHDLQGNN